MASDDIHGHGDEYRRSSAVLNLASRIAWPTWPIRLLLGCAYEYRLRNSDMAVPCRTKLRSAWLNEWVHQMFQMWTIFDHFRDPPGFYAGVAQLAVENFRDHAIRAF